MTIQELESKLNAAQERLDKSITLRSKYETKLAKAKEAIINIGYDPDNLPRLGDLPEQEKRTLWDLSWDYDQAKDALKSTDYKIKDLTQIRDNWKTRLELQKAKDNEFETIPQVVKDFVHNWRIKTEAWIKDNLAKYQQQRRDAYKLYEQACDYSNDLTYEQRKELKNKYNELYHEIRENTEPLIIDIANRSNQEEFITKLLDEEEKGKVFDLIRRVTKVTGTITDASALRIGEQSGELNGLVIGEEGKALVETIGAGGYNIQRFHYRVLVKKVRDVK